MIKFFFALLLGLAVGYTKGYGDAQAGRTSVATRALDKFGVGKVKAANEKRGKQIEGL